MKVNEVNVIIENVLSDKDISNLYDLVQASSDEMLVKHYGQSVVDFDLPKSIEDKIISISESISGETDLEIAEYQFARYVRVIDKDSGQELLPQLSPHWDDAFEEPRFTFDYQLGGNTSWPLVVEEKEFTLKNNSALTFSGTHQIHWREPKSFMKDEYLDMIFFHLKKRGSGPYPLNWPKEMDSRMQHYEKIYEGIKK
jgi:hypothetical protein